METFKGLRPDIHNFSLRIYIQQAFYFAYNYSRLRKNYTISTTVQLFLFKSSSGQAKKEFFSQISCNIQGYQSIFMQVMSLIVSTTSLAQQSHVDWDIFSLWTLHKQNWLGQQPSISCHFCIHYGRVVPVLMTAGHGGVPLWPDNGIPAMSNPHRNAATHTIESHQLRATNPLTFGERQAQASGKEAFFA